MRILHTSDWHLGHSLHGVSRDAEHGRFLDWLLDVLAEERPDALLITGDVYETATPPARAERAFFDVLARARALLPDLEVVVIGGNHDSAQRLEAPAALLRGLRVHVVGSLPRREDGALDLERLVVPLHDREGAVAAWVAAVPFLRPSDLPPLADEVEGDPLVAGVRQVYAEALAAARARRAPGQALVATGHCTLVGTALSELSERQVVVGGQHAVPASVFPDDLAYVALGHLHRPQAVGGREGVRYAGSPIPLSLTEVDYPHQVVVVDLEGERLGAVRSHLVPRAVELLRVPGEGPGPLEEVLPLLAALPERGEAAEETRPLLEVRVSLSGPEPGLRRQVEEALEGKAARLVKLSVERSAAGEALADATPQAALGDLDPLEVFARCYRRAHEGDPPAAYLEAFAALLDEVRSGEVAPAASPSAPSARPAEVGHVA